MTTKIELKNMHFHAFHGLMPQETKVGNDFIVSLCLTADLRKAVESDNYELTIDYSKVYNIVAEEMKNSSLLLEHVTGRIKNSIERAFPNIEEIEISVSKLNPPIEGADIECATVVIREQYGR